MKHYEIYNNVKLFCLVGILSILTFSCDSRDEEPLEENIEMWVNGSEFNVREYYESITTYGVSSVQEDGSIKKIFVFDVNLSLIYPFLYLQRNLIIIIIHSRCI